MKLIHSFFRATRIFWIISRLVLGLIFCYCGIFLLEGADTADYLSAAFLAVLGLTLLWGFIAGLFMGGANKWVRAFSGSVLILIALLMVYATIGVFGIREAALILLLPLWFFMTGLFELFGMRRKKLELKPRDLPEVPLNI